MPTYLYCGAVFALLPPVVLATIARLSKAPSPAKVRRAAYVGCGCAARVDSTAVPLMLPPVILIVPAPLSWRCGRPRAQQP